MDPVEFHAKIGLKAVAVHLPIKVHKKLAEQAKDKERSLQKRRNCDLKVLYDLLGPPPRPSSSLTFDWRCHSSGLVGTEKDFTVDSQAGQRGCDH